MKNSLRLLAILVLTTVFAYSAQNKTQTPHHAHEKTAPSTDCGTGAVALTAVPENADILVDGNFVGNAPAALKLAPGKHSIKVAAPGYGEWQREISVLGGSETRLAVTLEKQIASAPADTSPPSSAATPAAASATPAAPAHPAATAPSCGELGAFSDEHPKNRGDGVKVTGFAPHSAAAKAGIEIGDYIVALAGTYVFTIDDLTTELCKHKPGAQVSLRYRRNAALDETTVVLGP